MTGAVAHGRHPRGPEAVVEALCTATERLCNERPPGTVTVRQIAEAAGVNHGLVHQYFESKDALLAVTMVRVEEEVLHHVAAVDDPAEAIAAFFDEVNARPTYPRLLSWMLLEGIDWTGHVQEFPLVSHLVGLARADFALPEARLRIQALLSFVAGWATTHDFMAEAVGLTDRDRRRSQASGRTQAVAIALGPAHDLLG